MILQWDFVYYKPGFELCCSLKLARTVVEGGLKLKAINLKQIIFVLAPSMNWV